MNTPTKSARILPVFFPRYAAILRDDVKGPVAESTRNEARYSGWDIRKDATRGTKNDTGCDVKKSQYLMGDNGYSFTGPTRDLTRLYTLESDNAGKHEYSLLPPVASL